MNFEHSWGRWLLEWIALLVVTYVLTWGTMALINNLALAAIRRDTAPTLRWATLKDGRQIPATTDLLTGEGASARVKHFDIGARKWDDLPAALRGADSKAAVYWDENGERNDNFV